jgi:hypothetical protein
MNAPAPYMEIPYMEKRPTTSSPHPCMLLPPNPLPSKLRSARRETSLHERGEPA